MQMAAYLMNSDFRIGQLLKKEKDALISKYDFGNGWEQKFELEKIMPFQFAEQLPRCIADRQACGDKILFICPTDFCSAAK
jgi:hypothetical protein